CKPAPDPGVCEYKLERWFFNVNTGSCETFVYGGCGGNDNRYENQEECEFACKSTYHASEWKKICRLPADKGECQEPITRFYFDPTSEQCLPFIYGGCMGNLNRFWSIEECEAVCKC
ncbi:unnamed protein product, partial [Ixodes hexagonus]